MSAAGVRKASGRKPGGRRTAAVSGRVRQAWIGVDLSKEPVGAAPRGLYPLLALAVVAALGVAALRIDLLRTRYAVSTAMARENELIEEQRQLIVRRRQLRDPVALEIQARERGFRPPAHVVSLPDPTLGTLEAVVAPRPVLTPSAAVASVAAGPAAGAHAGGSDWE